MYNTHPPPCSRVVRQAGMGSGFGAETDRQRVQREGQAYHHDFVRLDKDLWWVHLQLPKSH